MKYVLNSGQQRAMRMFGEGKNVFITGSGGKGKSVLIESIMEVYGNETILVTPTGISALNVGGATIHSTFKLPFGYLHKGRRANINDKTRDLFSSDVIKRIIIDEISMVRSDTLVCIDQQLRKIKRKNVPFGGIQICAVGDFFQLPPVINNRSEEGRLFYEEFKSEFCFTTDTWKDSHFHVCELEQVMRQTNAEFIGHLESIRIRDDNFQNSIKFFNDICLQREPDDPVYLCTVNRNADTINDHFYDELDTEEKTFVGRLDGAFKERPVPEALKLKIGTKVMCRANTESMVNGETGYVKQFVDKGVLVEKSDGTDVIIEPYRWDETGYKVTDNGIDNYVLGSYKQIPLIHAYAVSIHKSQGLSLDEAIIHLGNGAFCHGQLYVALSRLRTLDGLGLVNPIMSSDCIVDPSVIKFYNRINDGKLDSIL